MFTYLKTLRNKPEAYRMRIVLISAAVVTGIIFLIWILATVLTFKDAPVGISNSSENPSVFSEISVNLPTILDTGKAQLNNIRSILTPPTDAP